MIVRDIDEAGGDRTIPAGLPAAASLRHLPLACQETLLLLIVPLQDEHERQSPSDLAMFTDRVTKWATATDREAAAPVVMVPLYGCHVVWTPGRAAVVGPAARLEQLIAAVSDFANREGELRQLEQRCADLVAALDGDAAYAFEYDEQAVSRRDALAGRFREAVAAGARLALLAPAVHAPPIHPPTLASQLGERLRDRTRLAERHEFAVDRVELAERLYEACGQRVAEFGIARRQLALEWAIVVLLVIQTALLVVDLLAGRGTT